LINERLVNSKPRFLEGLKDNEDSDEQNER
jgi:hypothetical protein